MDVKLNITLHKNQLAIHQSTARFKVIKAGKRFGKSKWAVFELCQRAGQAPGKLFWYLAPTYGQAADIAWNELLNILPLSVIRRKVESKLSLELTNGARIVLKGTENEDQLRGVTIDGGVIMDEAAYMDEYVWPNIIRGQLTANAFAYFISSPNKRGRNWFTGFCDQAKAKMLAGDPNWASWYFTIEDNPWHAKTEIESIKEQVPDDRWQLEYMAIESAHAGLIFSEFDPALHVGVLAA